MSRALRSFTYDGESCTATLITKDCRTITATFAGDADLQAALELIVRNPESMSGEWKASDHPGEELRAIAGIRISGRVTAFEDADVPAEPIPATPEPI